MGGCFGRPHHKAWKYGEAKPEVPKVDERAGDFHRSGDDRLWLFSRRWEPSEPHKAWATLMIVHGTVDHSGVYAELAETLVARGVAVFASDMRGWGRSDGEPLYFHDISVFADDVVDDYRRIHGDSSPYADVRARFLLGKSVGGLVTAWLAAREPALWCGLVGLSGAYALSPEQQPTACRAMALRALATLSPKLPLRRPFDPTMIVSDHAALQAWRDDPLVSHGRVTVGYLVELLRAMAELPKHSKNLQLPVLMLWGTGDRVVSEEGHVMLLKSSQDARSKFLRYPGGFHNLLAEPSLKSKVIADILDWMAKTSDGEHE